MVLLLLADGFEEIEAIGTVDILRRAGIKTVIAAVGTNQVVTSARNVKITADVQLQNLEASALQQYETLVLPGGGLGVENLSKSETVKALINEFASENKRIAAICAAPTLLGKMGLLKERKATCYPDMKDELFSQVYSEEPVVVDGNFITSRGAGTTHIFAAKIVEILIGKAKADAILEKMIF